MAQIPAKQTALNVMADLLKITTAFATGALVFSAGILEDKVKIPPNAIIPLVGSWILLGLAAASGVLAYSRIPVLLAEEKYDIEDPYLCWPGRLHQILFGLGIILLGSALVLIAVKRLPPAPGGQELRAPVSFYHRFLSSPTSAPPAG